MPQCDVLKWFTRKYNVSFERVLEAMWQAYVNFTRCVKRHLIGSLQDYFV